MEPLFSGNMMEYPNKLYVREQRGKKWVKVGIDVQIIEEKDRLRFRFPFNRALIDEIKQFDGARWQPDKHSWTVNNNLRNQFQLKFLADWNPYARYDAPLIEVTPNRPQCYKHQVRMLQHGLTRHYCIFAADMGVGKTLSAIELMEHSGYNDWIYVGPRSAINAVLLMLDEWQSKVRPPMYTYDGLKKLIANWPSGKKAPHGVIFDESSKLKNPQTQRSQSAMHIANAVREEWGEEGYVVLMTGTPAPKDPTDWYNQSETAQPGFLREGNIQKFKRRLALIVQKENTFTGGTYPALISWYDDENKCKHCGKFKDDITHDSMQAVLNNPKDYHVFAKSKNEIDLLYKRMKGLVEIISKKEALAELPDKIYRLIKVQPDKSTLRAASLIVKRAKTTIAGLTLLRELSDGFQYQDVELEEIECQKCGGAGEYEQPYYTMEEGISDLPNDFQAENRILPCPRCGGEKVVMTYQREAIQIPCPKEQIFIDILEEHEEVGRLVAYGGFTGTVDRMVEIATGQGWNVIRVDGRGWAAIGEGLPNQGAVSMLRAFQHPQEYPQRIIFIGQAGAAGMGLTLTASPSIFYYSNSFNAEDRIQSEDRIHRPGMDINKGATIIDIEHLPSDKRILDNLKAKRRLQDMSLGRFREEMVFEETAR